MYDYFKIKSITVSFDRLWHYCIVCSPVSFLILWSLTIRWHFKKDQEETQTLKFITLNLNIVPIFAPSSSLHQHTKERPMTMAEETVCEWCLGDCRRVGMLWLEKRCWWTKSWRKLYTGIWSHPTDVCCLALGLCWRFCLFFVVVFSSYMCTEI